MNEARAPTDEKIKTQILKEYQNGVGPKELSEKYAISINTIKSWLKRDKAKKLREKENEPPKEKGAPQKRKKGAPLGNKNAVGAGAPRRNKNAETHGFFSKYLPADAMSIIEEIEKKEPLDIIWENIQISYAAIVRAQKIMYVKDKDEIIKEIKKISKGDDKNEVEWEFQFSWDRQATFLTAQSRAMGELRSLIKQYDEMLHSNWEDATEEQKVRIDKLKAETEHIRQNNGDSKGNEFVQTWAQNVLKSRRDKNGK